MVCSIARLGLGGMVALALLLPIRWVSAQDSWTAGSGNWSVPGNWSAGVPGNGTIADIVNSDGVSRAITYDYNGAPVTLNSLTVDLTGGSGSAANTLSIGANNLTTLSGSGGEIIGNSGSGSVTQTGGTNTIHTNDPTGFWSSGVGFTLGYQSGATGTYNLSSGVLSAGQDGVTETIGFDGTGHFNQIGGTNNASWLLCDNGSYNLGGSGILTATIEDVGLSLTGTTTFTQMGGTHTITGSESAAGFLRIGTFNGAKGTYTLSGGTLTCPYVNVGGVGSSDGGGQGILNVSGSGSITVAGTLAVNNNPGTALNLTGGTINTGTLDLSRNPALLNWTDGTLNLTNSSVELDTSANNWNGFTSLTLNSGMALDVSRAEIIGGSGTGSLTLSGGHNFVGAAGLSVGSSIGSNGTFTITGNGQLGSNGGEIIGASGTGILNQSGGVNSPLIGNVSLGVNSGSSGTYSLSGGFLLSAPNIYVGGSASGPGGTGVLTVSGSGSIGNAGTITVYNTPGSGLNVNGGGVGATALNLMGVYMHTNGTASYGHITGGGQMSVSGGQVTLTDDTSGHLASVSVSGATALGFDINTTTSSQITADTATFNSTPTLAFTLSGYPDAGTVLTLLSATHFNDNGNLATLPSQAVTIGRDTLTPSLSGGSGAAGSIIVTVTGGPASLSWIGSNNLGGDGGGAWDTQTTQNWENHSNEALTPDVFYTGDHVTFDDTAANFIVDINSGVTPGAVTFNNSLHAYTVNGFNGIAGPGNVSFTGSNSVTLNTQNTYTGTTTISGGGLVSIAGSIASPTINVTHGTLQLAADNALVGMPVVTLGNGATTGTLDLDGTTNTVSGLSGGPGNVVTNTGGSQGMLVFAGGVSTFGGTIQDGSPVSLNITSGTLTLTGSNSYSGATTLNGGTLAITSDAAVNNGAGGITFGGGTLQFNNYASSNLPAAPFTDVPTLSLGAASGAPSSLSTAIGGISALTYVGPGTLQLTGNNSYSGGTSVNAGTLVVGHVNALGTGGLTINNTATTRLQAGLSAPVQLPNLSIAGGATPTATLDITNNNLVLHNGDIGTIVKQVGSGLNVTGALWSGPGIQSSTAAADAASHGNSTVFAVGAIQNVDKDGNAIYSTWPASAGANAASGLTTTDVLVKYTYFGDANLDGVVDNTSDYDLWSNGFTNPGLAATNPWLYGDFDYSGVVDNTTDYDLWSTGFAHQGGALSTPAVSGGTEEVQSVPEPGGLMLIVFGLVGLGLGARRWGAPSLMQLVGQ